MAKKKTKPAKKKARKAAKPQGVPDLDDRLKDAGPAKQYPPWQHLLKENKDKEKQEGEVMPPASSVESCMDPDRAKMLTAAMQDVNARRGAFDFKALQADVAQLMAIDAPTLRGVLLKHLELAALVSVKQVNDMLSVISAPETSEVAREILIRRLGSYAHFTEAVNRQRILIHKAGFMKDDLPDSERKDPADLSEEEWVAKYSPQLTVGTGKPPDVQ